jgi:hypothetical protein
MLKAISIEEIKHAKDTGRKPVVVSCDDFNDYLCKYSETNGSTHLMTEWISIHAAQCAGLNIPPFGLIDVSPEHYPNRADVSVLPNANFNTPLFGSKYLMDAKEVDKSVVLLFQSAREKNKIWKKRSLLEIALFDLWISNEDRNHGNYNLLVTNRNDTYEWVVIDHGEAFNSNSAMKFGLSTLTYNDSILQSELYHLIFQKPRNFAQKIDQILIDFERYIEDAKVNVISWIDSAPDEWGVDKEAWKVFLVENWLTDDWTNQVSQAFKEHCQSLIS